MAEEFVQVVKLKVDDSELRAAIENLRRALGDGVNVKLTAGLEKGLKDAGKEANKTAKETEKIAKGTKEAKKETDGLSKSFKGMTSAVKGLVAAYAGFKGISAIVGFGKGSIEAFNVQNRAERMLEFGMRQNGTAERADELKRYASTIQGRTIYGDEAMLSAAAGWQNKIQDVGNSKRMMDLVADFAAKSTGGGAVDAGAMKGFSQQLMQALSGRAITLKAQGFDISAINELQEIRRKGGNVTEDMEIAALEKVLAPIRGMAQELANTDEGKIQQLKNTIGDMREEVGRQLMPVVSRLAENIRKNLPSLKNLFESLGKVFESLVNAVTENIGTLKTVADWFSALMRFIGDHLGEIVAFGAGMKVLGVAIPIVSGGIEGLSIALKGLVVGNPLGAAAAGIAALVGVTLAIREKLEKSREDKRFEEAENAAKKMNERVNFKAKKGAEGYAQEQVDKARNELKDKILDYAKLHGGAVPQEWLDALNSDRDGIKHDYILKYRQGNKWTNVYGVGTTGKVIDPKTGKEFDPSVYSYDPNALTKKIQQDLKLQAKGDTTVNNVKVTNNITTDSDLVAKAIKENLRTLLTSQLNFTSRTSAAKALAI